MDRSLWLQQGRGGLGDGECFCYFNLKRTLCFENVFVTGNVFLLQKMSRPVLGVSSSKACKPCKMRRVEELEDLSDDVYADFQVTQVFHLSMCHPDITQWRRKCGAARRVGLLCFSRGKFKIKHG